MWKSWITTKETICKKKKLAPIHPGEHLSDILKESGITANALALRLRVPERRVSRLKRETSE